MGNKSKKKTTKKPLYFVERSIEIVWRTEVPVTDYRLFLVILCPQPRVHQALLPSGQFVVEDVKQSFCNSLIIKKSLIKDY